MLSDDYHCLDLNTDNPLGMHGELAWAFAEFMKFMWSGMNRLHEPSQIKVPPSGGSVSPFSRLPFCTPPHARSAKGAASARSADWGRVLSVQYTFCVCMCVCMLPLCSAKTEPDELKFGTLTMSSVGLLQPLEELAAMQTVGVASKNVR